MVVICNKVNKQWLGWANDLSLNFEFYHLFVFYKFLNWRLIKTKKYCPPCLTFFKIFFASLSLISLFFSSPSLALSATTVNAIEGKAPYLLLSDGVTKVDELNELLGFTMPKHDGSEGREQIDASMATHEINAPVGMKYSDVIPLVVANGTSQTLTGVVVADDDGDADAIANTFISGWMRATWYNNGVVVPSSNFSDTLDRCGGPYTLDIQIISEVSANTVYGYPRTTLYGTNKNITYTFMPGNMGICFIQPIDLTTSSGKEGVNIKFANGFNSAVFDRVKGFKVKTGFPTTGFYRAAFSLIGSGDDQSRYRCSSPDNNAKISLSGTSSSTLGANCTVTYNSKTKSEFISGGTPTIIMEYNKSMTDTPNWVVIDSYKVPIPVRWAVSKGALEYGNSMNLTSSTSFPALDACRGVTSGTTTVQQATGQNTEYREFRQKYMYRRNEFTNSPYSYYPEMNMPAYASNYFSRDVDGTFMGEWGNVRKYIGSGWLDGYNYWTSESWSLTEQARAYINGGINYGSPNNNAIFTMCRGD